MTRIVPVSTTMVLALLALAAVVALLILIGWAIARALASAGRSVADAAGRRGGQRPWSGEEQVEEPVIDVTARDVTDDLVKMIQENNRLLREILDELRRAAEPPPSPPGHPGHLD